MNNEASMKFMHPWLKIYDLVQCLLHLEGCHYKEL